MTDNAGAYRLNQCTNHFITLVTIIVVLNGRDLAIDVTKTRRSTVKVHPGHQGYFRFTAFRVVLRQWFSTLIHFPAEFSPSSD